jgi:hypothetical protein
LFQYLNSFLLWIGWVWKAATGVGQSIRHKYYNGGGVSQKAEGGLLAGDAEVKREHLQSRRDGKAVEALERMAEVRFQLQSRSILLI